MPSCRRRPGVRSGSPSQVLERPVSTCKWPRRRQRPAERPEGQGAHATDAGVMVDILGTRPSRAPAGRGPSYRALKQVKRKQLILAQECYTGRTHDQIRTAVANKVIKFKCRLETTPTFQLSSPAGRHTGGRGRPGLKLTEQGFLMPIVAWTRGPDRVLRRLRLGGFKDKASADLQRWPNERCGNYEGRQLATGRLHDPDLQFDKRPTRSGSGERL
jgi:hypothetical protein